MSSVPLAIKLIYQTLKINQEITPHLGGLPRFYGHLIKAHIGPGEVSWDKDGSFQLSISMSAVGSCADNTTAESFFGVLSRERVNRRQYRTRAGARADIIDYIERWHNLRQRRRLAFQQKRPKLLTQTSVETG